MVEKELQNQILLNFGSHDDIRLWRVNTGMAIGYSQVQQLIGSVNLLLKRVYYSENCGRPDVRQQIVLVEDLIKKINPTTYGVPGTADINGIVTYTRKDGSSFARFIGIEVKVKPRKATEEQIKWGQMVESRGGIWILAYSTDDVKQRLIKEGVDV